jgi:hypothetical protein
MKGPAERFGTVGRGLESSWGEELAHAVQAFNAVGLRRFRDAKGPAGGQLAGPCFLGIVADASEQS